MLPFRTVLIMTWKALEVKLFLSSKWFIKLVWGKQANKKMDWLTPETASCCEKMIISQHFMPQWSRLGAIHLRSHKQWHKWWLCSFFLSRYAFVCANCTGMKSDSTWADIFFSSVLPWWWSLPTWKMRQTEAGEHRRSLFTLCCWMNNVSQQTH